MKLTTAPSDHRWPALYVLCVGMLMIILDATIVNVALPSIQDDLGFAQADLAWVVNAYLIPFGGLLLLAGRLGDLISRKGVFLAGLGVFVAASLLCGLAQSQAMLIGARFAQGVGGAMTSAVILGMIVTMFPEPREQARAIGVYSFVASAGASLGLLAGGLLTEAINWHWIFFVNVPIGIATAVGASRLLQRDRGIGLAHGADVAGAALVTGSLMLGVYTIVEAAEAGWGSVRTLALGAVSLALLAGFVAREARTANPLMPLRILRSRNVAGANLIQVLMVAGLFGMFFLGALYLQRVLGFDPVEVGLAFLPVSVGIGVLSLRVSPRLITRFGPRPVLVPGLLLITAGLVLFTRVPVDGDYLVDVLPTMVLFGTGAGLTFPAVMTLAMSSATPSDAGLASGLVNTTQQVGGALGLAVLATLATTRTDGLLADGAARGSALTDGYQLASRSEPGCWSWRWPWPCSCWRLSRPSSPTRPRRATTSCPRAPSRRSSRPRSVPGVVRTLTQRELNRALLARQMLLERVDAPIPDVLERMGGLQAQYAPSTYLGLWSRVRGLERAAVTQALEERTIVQGTLLRRTIHAVSRADYWPFARGPREERRTGALRDPIRKLTASEMSGAARRLRGALRGTTLRRTEIEELVGKRRAAVVGLWEDLVRVPPSGTWERRRADVYALAEDWLGEPPELTKADAVSHLVRRYLVAFGPARRTDVAIWAGLPVTVVQRALDGLELRRFADDQGRELLDVPGAPLPPGETPAPVRFLPTYDATLLVHARRTLILPEEHRPRVFHTRLPQSVPTFLVDGAVAGSWRFTDGHVQVEPFEPLDDDTRAVDEEAERLAAFQA